MPRTVIQHVAVVAPAGLASDARVAAGLAALQEYGVSYVLIPPGEGPRHYLAGTDAYRADAIRRAWDTDADAIWALRGGFGCVRTLEALGRYDDRRPLLGFSDVSALLVNAPTGWHTPVITQLPNLNAQSKATLQALLLGEYDAIPLSQTRTVLREGAASGVLCGGNLTVLGSLCGTPWQPVLRDRIVFLEDVGEPPYRIDRVWSQLRLSGALEGVRGLVLGRFTGVADGEQETLRQLFIEMANDIDGPVIEGLPVGHSAENVPMPMGVPVTIDTRRAELIVHW